MTRCHPIVELLGEALERPEHRVRSNVATALAAIGDPDSLELLIRVARSDSDPRVREHAAHELRGLEKAESATVIAKIEQGLDDPEIAADSYQLLVRLHAKGWPGIRLTGRHRSRWRLAWAHATDGATLRWSAMPRAFTAGLAGVVLGTLLTPIDIGRYWPLLAFVALASAITSIFAARRAVPTRRRLDPVLGTAAETCAIGLDIVSWTALLGLGGALIALTQVNTFSWTDALVSTLAATASTALLVIAARVATRGSYGAFAGGVGTVWQTLVGGTAGLLAVALLYGGWRWWSSVGDGVVVAFWCLVPTLALAVSSAIARVDGSRAEPVVDAVRRRAMGIGLLTATGLMIASGLPGTPTSIQAVVDGDPVTRSVAIDQLPQTADFTVRSLTRASLVMPQDQTDVVLDLFRDGRRYNEADDPPELDLWLGPGAYRVRIREYESEATADLGIAHSLRQLIPYFWTTTTGKFGNLDLVFRETLIAAELPSTLSLTEPSVTILRGESTNLETVVRTAHWTRISARVLEATEVHLPDDESSFAISLGATDDSTTARPRLSKLLPPGEHRLMVRRVPSTAELDPPSAEETSVTAAPFHVEVTLDVVVEATEAQERTAVLTPESLVFEWQLSKVPEYYYLEIRAGHFRVTADIDPPNHSWAEPAEPALPLGVDFVVEVLDLRHNDEEILLMSDDPPSLNLDLAPGLYVVRARAYGHFAGSIEPGSRLLVRGVPIDAPTDDPIMLRP